MDEKWLLFELIFVGIFRFIFALFCLVPSESSVIFVAPHHSSNDWIHYWLYTLCTHTYMCACLALLVCVSVCVSVCMWVRVVLMRSYGRCALPMYWCVECLRVASFEFFVGSMAIIFCWFCVQTSVSWEHVPYTDRPILIFNYTTQ